ncbi:translation initiation factor IF-2-like isoform X3 [Benincasa hispida]|uniref:translation initiation factor IF-2-like isoform X3 n=1 Tax=Benincasa hispida TaxID=102211 RepID=UPI0018FF9FFC|nr:translation initiation factor IF-2-like isoform X3 [Benincasa hispida]
MKSASRVKALFETTSLMLPPCSRNSCSLADALRHMHCMWKGLSSNFAKAVIMWSLVFVYYLDVIFGSDGFFSILASLSIAHLVEDKRVREIVLKAMGQAISKAVAIAEILKKRTPRLHQETSISSVSITDVWEPIEEGLVPVEMTRHVSMISITLSNRELNKNSPGYQASQFVEQPKQQYNQQQHQQPRQSRPYYNAVNEDLYGQSQGRGRGRGRGWGRGGYGNYQGGYGNYQGGYGHYQGGSGHYQGGSSYQGGSGGYQGNYQDNGGYSNWSRGGGRGRGWTYRGTGYDRGRGSRGYSRGRGRIGGRTSGGGRNQV